MTKFVANLQLFDSQWKLGLGQAELVKLAMNLGFRHIEIRREYFRNIELELPEIAATAKAHNINLFYSIPDTIFDKTGAVNSQLKVYTHEAKLLAVSHMKMNIGTFNKFTGNLSEDLTEWLSDLTDSDIEVNVENDQSQENGTLKPILNFLEAAKQAGLDLGFTFDIGNWSYVGENALQVAEKLCDYVRYIHVKDVLTNKDERLVKALDAGNLNWREILRRLSAGVPLGLEFPAVDDVEIYRSLVKLEMC